ncbi:MAG: hypothetical protein ACRDHN_14380 [Thermomicrobiales bacterium]
MLDLPISLHRGRFTGSGIANQIGTANIPAGTAVVRIGIAIETGTAAAEAFGEDAEVIASSAMSWMRAQVETTIITAGFLFT